MNERPLSLTNARPKRVNGSVSKTLPPMANKIAKISKTNIVKNLILLDNFFEEKLAHHFNKKYKIVKIITV